jgi:hypothetical protein
MKKILVVLWAVTLVFSVAGATSASTLLNSGIWSENYHDYLIVSFPEQSWDDARSDIAAGYDLATITSADEQAFIESLLEDIIGEYWLGGYQYPLDTKDASANWTWVTGESWSYTNWFEGEPNDNGGPGREQHLAMWDTDNWQWNDQAWLPNITGYIAESTAPVPEPTTMLLLSSGLIGLAGFRRKFKRG